MKQNKRLGKPKLPESDLFPISYEPVSDKVRARKDEELIDRIILTLNRCEKNGHFTVPASRFNIGTTSISMAIRRELRRRNMAIVFIASIIKDGGKVVSIRFKRKN
jgi:hypothetical protein